MAADLFFSEDLIRKRLADEQVLKKAKKYGKKFVLENRDAKLTAYQWQGITYIIDLVLY